MTLKDILAGTAIALLGFALLYAFMLISAPCGQYEPLEQCQTITK